MKASATGTGLNSAAWMYLPNCQAQYCRRQKCNGEIEYELLRFAVARQARDYSGELDAIFPDDRQHRAGLNHDLKNLAFLVIEPEQLATMIKCPVLDMGKNSVRPSTTPSISTLIQIMMSMGPL